jgi:folate-binding protein YgfZ
MFQLPEPARSFEDQVASLREGAGARVLDDELLVFRGADRIEWLSGMVTQEARSMQPGASRYTAVVHVKGKLLADAWLFARADDVVMAVPHGTASALLEHFGRYIIMEDVEPARLVRAALLAVQGPRARDLVPQGVGVFASDRLGRGGVAMLIERDEQVVALRDAIVRGDVVVAGELAWEAARLEAGVPQWGTDFGPENYVQEAGITTRAVSFHKGCYLGQEVVCRLEMRGHVRRQLVALAFDTDTEPPARGARVDGDHGEVTSSARSPALGRPVAMAMVKWDLAAEPKPVDVGGVPARIVQRPVP